MRPSYAIPTKGQLPDRTLVPLSLVEIRRHVERFLAFAASRPDLTFEVTPIGCGLSGYKCEEIGPMFAGAPANCTLPAEFNSVLAAPSTRLPAPRVPALRFPSRAR